MVRQVLRSWVPCNLNFGWSCRRSRSLKELFGVFLCVFIAAFLHLSHFLLRCLKWTTSTFPNLPHLTSGALFRQLTSLWQTSKCWAAKTLSGHYMNSRDTMQSRERFSGSTLFSFLGLPPMSVESSAMSFAILYHLLVCGYGFFHDLSFQEY